tara:strand:+ start:11242 stop:12909 length:1668 start_codon:yes stop_codon:yes gene_type:complete
MKIFLKFLKLKYSYFLIFTTLLVAIFEFLSYGLAYPIISIFLDLEQNFLSKINNFISKNLGMDIELKESLLVTFLIAILFLQSLSFIIFRFITLKITLNYLFNLRSNIFNSFFDSVYNPNIKISEILNSLTIQSMNAFHYWSCYIDCIKRILIIAAILVLFIIISFKVLITSTLILFLLFLLINKISSLSQRYGKNMVFIDQTYLNASNQSLNNYKYIKITNIKDKLLNSIIPMIKDFNSNQFKFTMLSKLIKESSEPIAVIMIILIGYFSSYYLNINVSLLIISVLLLRRLIANISSLFRSYQSLVKYKESIKYIEKILSNFQKSPSLEDNSTTNLKEINLNNIYFEYSKGKPIFKNLNLSIKRNKPAVIYGKSGSGKSSLINLITGITSPLKGNIFYNNLDIYKEINIKSFKIGIVLQEEVIFNMSLIDNLLLRNPKAKRKKIIELIKTLGLEDIFQNQKIDLNMNINEISSNLSGGEKQRIALIREILYEPDLLILDEATSALDQISLKKTIKFLNKIKNKTTLLIFTHQNEFKKYNFDIYELKNNNLSLEK